MAALDVEERTSSRSGDSDEIEARSGIRRPGSWLAAVVVALGIGLLAGWLAWGSDSGDDLTFVTPGGVELTDRQSEMIDIVDQYVAAWAATDGDRAASFMTEDGYIEYPKEGWRFEVADRSMQSRISNGPYGTLELIDPVVVYKDRAVLTGRIDSIAAAWLSVVHFTDTGDVQIVSESIYHWSE